MDRVDLGFGYIETSFGRRPYRVTGSSVLAEIRTSAGREAVLARMGAEVWMRWAQGNADETEYPPTLEEIRANLECQARWVEVFSDPTI